MAVRGQLPVSHIPGAPCRRGIDRLPCAHHGPKTTRRSRSREARPALAWFVARSIVRPRGLQRRSRPYADPSSDVASQGIRPHEGLHGQANVFDSLYPWRRSCVAPSCRHRIVRPPGPSDNGIRCPGQGGARALGLPPGSGCERTVEASALRRFPRPAKRTARKRG